MSIKITIKGLPKISFECETVEEAVELVAAKTILIKNAGVSSSRNSGLNENGRHILLTLRKAYPNGLNSGTLSVQLGLQPKSLPSIMVRIRSWLQQQNKNFDDVVVRKKSFVRGKPLSTYFLSEEGYSILEQYESLLEKGEKREEDKMSLIG